MTLICHRYYGHEVKTHVRGTPRGRGFTFSATLMMVPEQFDGVLTEDEKARWFGLITTVNIHERSEKRILAKARRGIAAWERKHNLSVDLAYLTILPIQ